MTMHFDTWLTKQIELGLADIKVCVIAGKGISVQAIQTEMLAAESAIETGGVRAAPRATSALPSHIAAFVTDH